MVSVERPLGVSILAILYFIGGVLSLVQGLFVLAGGAALLIGKAFSPLALGSNITVAGLIAVIIAIVDLALGYGLWTGKEWARIIIIIFCILGILASLVLIALGALSFTGGFAIARMIPVLVFVKIFAALPLVMGLITLVIDVLIVYYLTRPHVKAFFKKQYTTVPPPPA